ncbi:MAG TPA: MEDS domain-containing protein [Acidimicrobiales bacterium]|nr:MEDS domain-containing protein [Acidimicrobiales bacterium]
MRNRGSCFELLRMRPHDHIGWVFTGSCEFAAVAKPFLEEGAQRGERLMYVADDPGSTPMAELAAALDSDTLQIARISEVYGESGVVDADTQRATFADALAEALTKGYTGIRVAADNTPLVTDPERLQAWIRWEIVADRLMSENPVTGLCAFDRQRINIDTLRHLATLHPLAPSDAPAPQFLLFSDEGQLRLEGEVDAFAVSQAALALKHLPPKTELTVDLTATVVVTKAVMVALHRLIEKGLSISVRDASGEYALA